MENEDVIRHQMEDTRAALTEKLETLEDKLIDTVQETKSAVQETAVTVKETVHESVESVKDMMDVPAHVERHPWLALGGAVLCGYMLGSFLPAQKEVRQENLAPQANGKHPPPQGNGRHKHPLQKVSSAETGESWLSAFDPVLQKLKGLAVGAALGTVREMISEQVPPHMAGKLRGIIDEVTVKAGGEPIPHSDFASVLGQEADRF